MVADIRDGMYTPDDTVIFLHTGGSPALFAQRDILPL
jgi:1-aminocyclopropane-1-carboxylate deaminase/D-cysteine desulfhydrase-like pyridoxal-dependent ACC family enzyme